MKWRAQYLFSPLQLFIYTPFTPCISAFDSLLTLLSGTPKFCVRYMAFNRYDHRSQSLNLWDRGFSHAQHDDDTLSLISLNEEVMIGLDQLASQLDTLLRPRLSTHKRLYNSIVPHKDANRTGWIINGSLFDEQIFQPTRPSCITSYANAPHDLNRFLQGHHMQSDSSPLDMHLFKLAFALSLSDALIGKELILGSCPHEDHVLEEIQHYKRFCFPELHADHHASLLQDSSTYIFTRTLSTGQVEYGYCRRLPKECNRTGAFPVVLCIGRNRKSPLRITNNCAWFCPTYF